MPSDKRTNQSAKPAPLSSGRRDAEPSAHDAPPLPATGAEMAATREDDTGRLAASLTGTKPKSTLSLGLPAKLLLLTAVFVMLAEILIFVPSIANFRVNWLNDRLTAARLASLAAEAAPGGTVPETLRQELLRTAEVKAVAVRKSGIRRMVLPPGAALAISASYDMRPMNDEGLLNGLMSRLGLIGEAMMVFANDRDRIIRIIGPLGNERDDFIEVVVPERPLCEAMVRFGLNILILSIFISLITAALVYVALSGLLVRPMMRISSNMLHFSENPEDASRIITPSNRTDEIGTTERELADMQGQLVSFIRQKNRLAQLGLAVSKINHDLRNMLANAQLLSDRLSAVPDPTVQRFTPKLIASLDRAINFCNDTLRYGRAEEAAPRRTVMRLAPMIQEVCEGLGLPRDGELRPTTGKVTAVGLMIDIPENLTIDADPDHLHRVLSNICRNAVQILEANGPALSIDAATPGRIDITAHRMKNEVIITIGDNGPGLPPRARENLFRAFQGSQRKGGTGLGLVIAAELMSAHGGSLTLLDTDAGAAFKITIPDRLTS